MKIGHLDVQPIMLYLPDTEYWRNRHQEGKQHFIESGITDLIEVAGIYGQGFGIDGTHEYNLDNPSGHHKIGVAYTAGFLSMYMMYNIARVLPNEHFLFLEDDTRFNEGWLEKLSKEVEYLPSDFDFLFVGSCCAHDKPKKSIRGDIYEFNAPYYPMGGNAYIISKKCLDHVIATQRDAYAPADISLTLHSFPQMKVFALLPRICNQKNNNLPL